MHALQSKDLIKEMQMNRHQMKENRNALKSFMHYVDVFGL